MVFTDSELEKLKVKKEEPENVKKRRLPSKIGYSTVSHRSGRTVYAVKIFCEGKYYHVCTKETIKEARAAYLKAYSDVESGEFQKRKGLNKTI